ncbi:hypothetical protein K440DRAFT_644603 [Wilcoxina mikolae CBS 423.85]|nr:hypothetical protein K440DRAFT_644603 [Wilcoxina mikolae CBS 423.85]
MAFRPILTTAATTSRKFIPLSITRIRPLVIPAAATRALAFHRAYSNKCVFPEGEEVKQKCNETGSVLHSELSQQHKSFDARLKKTGERVEQVQQEIEVAVQQRLDNHAGRFFLFRKMLEEFQDMNMAQCSRIDGLHRRQEEFAEKLGRNSLDLVETENDIESHERKIAGLEDTQSSLKESLDTKLEELKEKVEELTTEKESSGVTEVREQLGRLEKIVAMRGEEYEGHVFRNSNDIKAIRSDLERFKNHYDHWICNQGVRIDDLAKAGFEAAKIKEFTLRLEEQISEMKQHHGDADKAFIKKEVLELLKPQNVQLCEHGQQLSGLGQEVSGHNDEISVLKAHVKTLLDGLKQAEKISQASTSIPHRGRI